MVDHQTETKVESSNSERIRVNEYELDSFRHRPSLWGYVKELHRRRHFIQLDARTRALQKNRDYKLGQFWLVASPLLDSAMYAFIFGVILNTGDGVDSFLSYLILGVSFFAFISGFLNTGAGLLQGRANMIRSFSFPRASLVLSAGLRNTIDNIVPAIVGVSTALVFQWGTPVHFTIILAIPLFILLHIFGTGIMFCTARLTAILLDFRALISIFNRLWFYGSGVFYAIDRFSLPPIITTIMTHNPAYVFLSAIRNVVIYETIPPINTWAALGAWSFGTLTVGFIWFWRGEESYINVVR